MKSPLLWWVLIMIVLVSSTCVINIQDSPGFLGEKSSYLSASSQLMTAQKREKEMSQNLISAEIEPLPNKANQAAKTLQGLGFQILHIGTTISVQAQHSLWESTFNVSFKEKKKTTIAEIGSEVTYLSPMTDNLLIPEELTSLIAQVMFVEPPEFY